MARLVWTETARDDLHQIADYIAADSPSYARSFLMRLRRSVSRLAEFPTSGRLAPEDDSEAYREVIVGNYRVIYRLAEEVVLIVAVLHGARDVRGFFTEDEDYPSQAR